MRLTILAQWLCSKMLFQLLLHLQQQNLPFSFSPLIGSLTRLHLSALPRRTPLEAVQPVCKKLLIHHILPWQRWIKRPYLEGNT